MKILKAILAGFLVCSICVICPGYVFGETKREFEERISSELTIVLDRFLGIGKSQVVVFVDAEPIMLLSKDGTPIQKLDLGKKVKDGKKSPVVQWLWSDYSRRTRKSLMPGFSARQKMIIQEQTRTQPAPSEEPEKRKEEKRQAEPFLLWKVTRMVVSVILDRSIEPKDTEMVGAMVMDVVGLDPDRGDKLSVYKLPFIPTWQLLLTSPVLYLKIFKILGWFLLISLLCYALYRYSVLLRLKVHHIRQKLGLVSAGEENSDGGGEEGAKPAAPLIPQGARMEQPAGEKPTVPSVPNAFGFVNAGNARLLGELVGGWSPQTITALVSFLGPTLGKVVLDQLSTDQRENVLAMLTQATSVESKELREMDAKILERLRFAIGGTEFVADLISQQNSEEQNAFLEKLAQKSPHLAGKVRKAIFRFEDIFSLPEREIRVLGQIIPFNEWTQALDGMPPEHINMICRTLPEEVRKVFLQHMEFNTSADGGCSQARWKILKTVRHLQVEGRISLRHNDEPPKKTPTIMPQQFIRNRR